jgi:hypothetical protein
LIPPSIHDLVVFEGKLFAYWPPFPALLLMPFVMLFGVNFSDILFTIIIGSINISLLTCLLKETNKKEITFLNKFQRSILTLFFAFGTVYITMVPLGRVWFSALVIGVFCVLFAYYTAIKFDGALGFFFAGLGISIAFATRMDLIFTGVWPAWFLLSKHWNNSKRQLIRYVLVGLMPIIATGILLALYNYMRFGNIFDLGLNYHKMSSFFQDDFLKYGAFNIHYILPNLFYQYIAYPFFAKTPLEFFMGGSLFLLSPVYFAIFWAFKKNFSNIGVYFLVITIILTNVPILLLMGTGWVQFGPRYTLDFSIPLLLLTAKGITYWSNKVLILLTIISLIHYLLGLYLLAQFR